MTTTATRAPARYLDRERTETALAIARSILLGQTPIGRAATAYGLMIDEVVDLLHDLARDITRKAPTPGGPS